MVAAMALAPAPSPIAVLGTAWMESGGSLSDKPSLQVSIPPYCFNRPGGGQVAQCPDPARDVGCEEDRVPCPRELCCAVPEKGQRSAYQAKELGTLPKPPVPRPITDQLCHPEQATHRAQ